MHPDAYADTMETFGDKVATAVTTVHDSWTNGGTVLHCTAGRDRTGLVLGLLLQLPDIPGDQQTGTNMSGSMPPVLMASTNTTAQARCHTLMSRITSCRIRKGTADRLSSYRRFLKQWPGDRVAELLDRHGL